ncbi:cop9 signalosome complex subunit 12 [Lentinula edodes]|uniref:Cop9 signalosome complex subunit 12 n=1 Tax=Lentinula edodes TaxID=5353 RepID=A0A1Q3EGU9_LENED|nr:cop9 signalosome complex subunit 12 [Lentinula edodes]
MDFATFLSQINDALISENGPNLAYLLRPTSPHGKSLVKEFRSNATQGSLEPAYKGAIHLKKHTENIRRWCCDLFLRFFTENRGWTLPALFSILRDLRDLAFDADFHAKYNGEKSECMEDAARKIASAFGNCITDRQSPPEQSRKWGVYYVVALVLKCYFRLKRISLSKNILRALEANRDIPALSQYPRSHQVTFRYYLGMLHFLNEDHAKAEEELTLAFYHCHTGAHANQERILAYLLPLRLLKGHLPSDELMKRFPVLSEMYTPFVTAIRLGDIAAFDRALEEWESKLVDLSLMLTVERARELCLRGLFRRVWVASDKNSRIPVSVFHCSLRISGMDVDQEEAECLVANMIYKGFMRGYISHEKQMVVLAMTNAFPKLVDRPSPFAYL